MTREKRVWEFKDSQTGETARTTVYWCEEQYKKDPDYRALWDRPGWVDTTASSETSASRS